MHKKILLTFLVTSFFLTGCFQTTSIHVTKQLELANKYLISADYEEAIFALQKAIQIDPKNIDAHILLADTLAKVGRIDEATEVLKKAQKIENIDNEKNSQITEKLESLEYLVGFSTISGTYSDSISITLSNSNDYDIIYSLDTENSRLSANELIYNSPIILDDDGIYTLSSYCIDDNGDKHDISTAKYVIQLDRNKYTNNSWELNEGVYRYRDSAGLIAIGWQQIDGLWYYLMNNGDMTTGWQQIDGIWYHFDENGIMTVNNIVDGYIIDADGIISGVDSSTDDYKNIFKTIYKEALTEIYTSSKLNDVIWDGNDSKYMQFILSDANGDYVDDLIVYGGVDYGKIAIFGIFDNQLITMFEAKNVGAFSTSTQSILEIFQEEGADHSLTYFKYDNNSHKFSSILEKSTFQTQLEGQSELRRIRDELGGLNFSPETLHASLTLENINSAFN